MNKKIVNIMGLVASIVIMLVLASSFVKSYRRIKLGDELIEKTKVKLEKIEKENEKLDLQLQITKSEEYKEKQFRDKMGFAKEGEMIVILPSAEELKKLVPELPKNEEVKLKPNWKKWLELFK